MVDALVSGTSVARRGGSSPLIRTNLKDRPRAGLLDWLVVVRAKSI
jgi:hypothetical protein